MSFGPNSYVERLAERIYDASTVAIFIVLFVAVLAIFTDLPRDATDPPSGAHSGLTLYTDHGTGCQYLGRSGTLTPRMQADGKQAGCRS